MESTLSINRIAAIVFNRKTMELEFNLAIAPLMNCDNHENSVVACSFFISANGSILDQGAKTLQM